MISCHSSPKTICSRVRKAVGTSSKLAVRPRRVPVLIPLKTCTQNDAEMKRINTRRFRILSSCGMVMRSVSTIAWYISERRHKPRRSSRAGSRNTRKRLHANFNRPVMDVAPVKFCCHAILAPKGTYRTDTHTNMVERTTVRACSQTHTRTNCPQNDEEVDEEKRIFCRNENAIADEC